MKVKVTGGLKCMMAISIAGKAFTDQLDHTVYFRYSTDLASAGKSSTTEKYEIHEISE